jgi:hypothetical protein
MCAVVPTRIRGTAAPENSMPFCDMLNAVFNWLQLNVDLLYGLFGATAPQYSEVIGSVLGCNIV